MPSNREKNFRGRYNITVEEYDSMVESQSGLCAICRCKPNHPLRVDHSHRSLQTRELLCARCNWVLGSVNDSQDLLQRFIAYLAKHGELDTPFIEDNPAAAEAREAEWQRTLDSSLNGQDK